MGWDAISILTLGLGGGLIADKIGGSNPTPPALPTLDNGKLPDQTKADDAGKAAVADQRRTLLAAGGLTDYTQGKAPILGTDVSKTTLLGG